MRQREKTDARLAAEVSDFLHLFPWKTHLTAREGSLRVADIGAKNFFLAEELYELFSALGFTPELHGFEIDAYRRYRNLRTRYAYGQYYASKVPGAVFHPTDFLRHPQSFDVVVLLNPFVSLEPHLAWGLPASAFRPKQLFDHVHRAIEPSNGLLLVSSPTTDELLEVKRLASSAGFHSVAGAQWQPTPESLQRRPRFGSLFRLAQTC